MVFVAVHLTIGLVQNFLLSQDICRVSVTNDHVTGEPDQQLQQTLQTVWRNRTGIDSSYGDKDKQISDRSDQVLERQLPEDKLILQRSCWEVDSAIEPIRRHVTQVRQVTLPCWHSGRPPGMSVCDSAVHLSTVSLSHECSVKTCSAKCRLCCK